MALGSSAPEILLSVIETAKDLRAVPGELGPSTIVGSASFNLLMISAASIIAVDEPKKIFDTGTFTVTSISSLWAYIWMYLCLETNTPGIVTSTEGWLTLVYFVFLIMFAYITDKINNYFEQNKRSAQEIEEQNRLDEIKIRKNQLRQIAREFTDQIVIEVARGVSTKETNRVPQQEQAQIKMLY